ncbi:NDR1/HIN1-like protein [Dyadobacter jejuensis]|nr:LEA type 2 family protein [Dyadobacter jejuensis]
MKINQIKAAILIFGISMFISCSEFTAPQIVSMQNIQFQSLRNNELHFSLESTIKNTNTIPLWVDKMEVAVFFDGELVGTADSPEQIKLPGNTTSDVTLHYKVPIKKLKSNFISLLSKKEIQLKVEGKYTFKNDLKDITIPYTYETPFNMKKHLSGLLLGSI